MQKLIAAYKADPSMKNAKALITYYRKHPFAGCFVTRDETDLLIAAGKQVNAKAEA